MSDATDMQGTGTATEATGGGCGCGGCGCGASGGGGAEGIALTGRPGGGVEPGDLDVRGLTGERRDAQVLTAVAGLLPGEGFVVADAQDLRPLRAVVEEGETGTFGWRYLAEGPEVWRVLVSRETCC